MANDALEIDRHPNYPLFYRKVEAVDVPILYAWNQNEKIVQYLPSMPKPLSWIKHVRWAEEVLSGINRIDLLILTTGDIGILRPIGRVHATDLQTYMPEVGILIGDTEMWGKGIATRAIAKIKSCLHERGPWEICQALIHSDNLASKRAFLKNGFEFSGFYGRSNQEVWHSPL